MARSKYDWNMRRYYRKQSYYDDEILGRPKGSSWKRYRKSNTFDKYTGAAWRSKKRK